MQKTRSLFAAALAALALCASAFASPADSPSAGFPAVTQVSAKSQDIAPAAVVMAAKVTATKAVSHNTISVADTGNGADSAYQAWVKRQAVMGMHPGCGEREQHPMASQTSGGGKRCAGSVMGMDLKPALMTIRDMHLAPIPRRLTRST